MAQIETKTVNIYPRYPIFTVKPTIVSNVLNQPMKIADIKACLLRQARVEEVLPSGKTVKLDLNTLAMDTEKRLREEAAEEERRKVLAGNSAQQLTKTLAQLQEVTKENTKLSTEVATQKTQLESATSNLEKANKEISNLKSQLQDKGADTALATKAAEAEAKVADLTSELETVKESLNNIKNQKIKIEGDLTAATKNVESLSNQIKDKDAKIKQYADENAVLTTKVAELETKLSKNDKVEESTDKSTK